MTEAHVIERIEQIPAVTSLVSGRIYGVLTPQGGTFPSVRVQRISAPKGQHLRGPDGLSAYRFQVDTLAQAVSGADWLGNAQAIADAIRGDGLGDSASGLWGWIGILGGSPAEVHVWNVELLHDGDPEYMPDELRQVRIRQDYLFHWSPAT